MNYMDFRVALDFVAHVVFIGVGGFVVWVLVATIVNLVNGD